MAFDQSAVNTLIDKVVSHALTLGYFDRVNVHEPKSAPGTGLSAAVWVQTIRPVRSSGLAATSGIVSFEFRIYTSMLSQPYDAIDPQIMTAVASLMGAYSGDFDFGGATATRNVDLLGQYGNGLSAQAGYITIDNKHYRVMTLSVPVIINDMFAQAG